MSAVSFYFIEKDGVEKTRELLKARFCHGSTVPGTRSFHMFVPQGNGVIPIKRFAEDESFAGRERTTFLVPQKMLNYIPKNRTL